MLGYPYTLDLQNKVINVRAIKGHIIGTGKQLFPGPPFQSYELSFLTPRGLPGAPLLTEAPTPGVCGMIVNHRSHEMEVASSRETMSENGSTNIYTKVEMMHIGVAIQQSELVFTSFDLIDGTIANHLARNQLLEFPNAPETVLSEVLRWCLSQLKSTHQTSIEFQSRYLVQYANFTLG